MSKDEHNLQRVTVGKVKPLNGTITLEPFSKAWAMMYAEIKAEITEALGSKAIRIEHVGSTSVEELSAKPIIDVVLEVPDSADEPAYVPALEAIGYVLRIREPGWFGHRLLKSPNVDGNIHVFSAGCTETEHMVAFQDWLRTNEADRKFCEKTKQQLASKIWKHVQNYADAKTAAIDEIMNRALDSAQR